MTKLYFTQADFNRLTGRSPGDRLRMTADLIRFNTLLEIIDAGSGHIGASFSCAEALAVLYHNNMRIDAASPGNRDRFVLSKGHAAPALYATLASCGFIQENELSTFRKFGGLQGHADICTHGVDSNTGSLGMGISKAKGYAMADPDIIAYVLVGDGELQEGQNWEAIMSAANLKVGNLIMIVDRNKVQTDMEVERIGSIEPLDAKLRAFGWDVSVIDGHDPVAYTNAMVTLCRGDCHKGRPKAIIADTTKGKGVTFMEARPGERYKWHANIPDREEARLAYDELYGRLSGILHTTGIEIPAFRYPDSTRLSGVSLKQTFSDMLLKLGNRHPQVTVLDADLSEDNGLRPFENSYPDRFIQCGIAEQDMTSTASSLAASGRIPIVNTYAAFLASRANEQIFNSCSERAKVLYVGHMAGVIPGRPGKSHQAVRDISLLGSVPDLIIFSPSMTQELEWFMKWFVGRCSVPAYLRLEHTGPDDLKPSFDYKPSFGEGCLWKSQEQPAATIVTYGPTLTHECMQAKEELLVEGIHADLISMPWLNRLDDTWMRESIRSGLVICVENHSIVGGLSDFLRRKGLVITSFGVDGWPQSGDNASVLKHFNLTGSAIAGRIHELVD